MRAWIFATLMFGFAGLAQAQQDPQQSPVLYHYEAYRVAFEAGDLAAAEAEAAQALAASEAQSGDGGSTAVLALNLATTRLLRGDAAGALPLAQRALALAGAGARGVDPNLAALVVGRAELSTIGASGAARLETLLAGPAAADLPPNEVYSAAAELAVWATAQREFARAQGAWAVAAEHADGSPLGEAYGYGRARTWQASAIITSEIGEDGRRRIDRASATEALSLLAEALETLRPLATVEDPGGGFTIAQRAFAEAMAWQGAVEVKLRAQGNAIPRPPDGPTSLALIGLGAGSTADEMVEIGPQSLSRPRCWLQLEHRQLLPDYPRDMLSRNQLAIVILRMRVGESGEIIESMTAARVGNEAFSEAIQAVSMRWSMTIRDDSPPNCRMSQTVFVPIRFIIG